MHLRKKIFITIVLLVILCAPGLSSAAPPSWQTRVDPWVLSSAKTGETEFLVYFTQQANLSKAANFRTKKEKGQYVFEQLTRIADQTQPPLIKTLMAAGVDFRPYWITNMLWVRADLDIIRRIAARPDVAYIYANPTVRVEVPAPGPDAEAGPGVQLGVEAPEAVEWNIRQVDAPRVWDIGFTGSGAVIGGQDTGYDWDHPALKSQYRGWDGETVDHNYHWHDAIHDSEGVCGFDSPEPCDDHGHGTHTMGTMVGDDGDSHQIGIAPGARWIGCRNMNGGVGSSASYSECYQWFLAPTNLNGENPRPELAPDVINNSWSCPPDEAGCEDPNVMLTIVENLRAAGIVTVHSAGNGGSSCSTVNTPAAIYDASFTVGATDSSDNIAGFSSRGPVTIDGSQRLKPDVSAPGVSILSSTRGGGYGTLNGTSMAAPHVAGLVALLISANPDLRGQVDTIEYIIRQSAQPRTTSQDCGGLPGSQVPNNTYGWGRIDAWEAVQHAPTYNLQMEKTPSLKVVEPGGTLSYTLTVTNTHTISPTTNVVLVDEIPEGTSFISATTPYTDTGGSLRWEIPRLGPLESQSVELVVRAPDNAGGTINNQNYWASSDQVPDPVFGGPVLTPVRFKVYLHMIYNP